MFIYIKSTIRERWPLFSAIILVISLVSFGYMGSRSVTERIIIQATDDLEKNWRYHYDLLVVPKSIYEANGLSDGWVAPQSTIASYGGISIEDLELIRGIPNVETAAPLSIIGYSTVNGIDLEYIDAVPGNYYEIQHVQNVFDGLKTYKLSNKSELKRFAPIGTEKDEIAEQISRETGKNVNAPVIGTELKKPNELLIIAIDPEAENELFTFTESLEGSFRLEDAVLEEESDYAGIRMIPVVKLAKNEVEMKEKVVVNSIEIPADAQNSGDLSRKMKEFKRNEEVNITVNSFQNRWNRNHVAIDVENGSAFKESNIAMFASSRIDVYHYQPIQYSNVSNEEGNIPLIAAQPVQIESESKLPIYRHKTDTVKKGFGIDVLNYYHPKRIKPILNGNWLEGDPLDIYTPDHSIILKDGAGNSLSPTPLLPLPLKNAYSTGSPDLITTLEAATYFYGSEPPISSIRIVVKDVAERTAESQRKIEDVAAQIRELTGHQVELMLGSTASKVHIDLGVKKAGSPGIVEEAWQRAGVNWTIQEQIEKSNLILFIYLLIVSLILCYTMITHSLLRRSRDFAMLRAIGWSRRNIMLVLLAEVFGLTAISFMPLFIVNLIADYVKLLELSVLLLVNLIVIGLGYWIGSRKALKMSPRTGLEGNVTEWRAMRLFSIRGLFTYIVHQMVRRPLRFGLLATVVALTSFMGILFIATRKSLSEFLFLSFLGETIDLNLSGFQSVFLGLGIFITVSNIFLLLYLNYIERRFEYSILRAIGWSIGRIQIFVVIEVLLVATIGSGLGVLFAYVVLITYSNIAIPINYILLVLLAPSFIMILFSILITKSLNLQYTKGVI